eukprot:9276181-Karenia_brevis.AAC.1
MSFRLGGDKSRGGKKRPIRQLEDALAEGDEEMKAIEDAPVRPVKKRPARKTSIMNTFKSRIAHHAL